MKKTILISVLALGAICANAQKVKDADVPAVVTKEFKSLYSDAKDLTWEKEKGNYEANFKKGTTEMSVTIDASGKLLETETTIASSSLPKSALDYISKNLPGKKIKEASEIKDASGKVTYEAEIDEVDYTFDTKGNFLKKEADND